MATAKACLQEARSKKIKEDFFFQTLIIIQKMQYSSRDWHHACMHIVLML